jgi:flagellar biosynthesis anti-sigma factor FlgM
MQATDNTLIRDYRLFAYCTGEEVAAMKINEIGRVNAVWTYQMQQETRAGSKGAVNRRDEVRISAEAQQLLSDSRILGAERAERINELKRSVSTGTYYVDAGKIADKLWPYLK